jgi:hypothetical protein
MKAKRLFAIITLAFIASIAAGTIYLYLTRIPQVGQDPAVFWKQKGLMEVPSSPQLQATIWRARLDFMLFPTEVGSGELALQSINQGPDILYIVFRPLGTSHTAVVYAYTVRERKPLWKSQIAMD